ncbi:GNAT family N-acetyltransferase [Bailinhaonella thermotolerans]|uniref:GNAT family N-acetyltransferase n=1 Tax=Bailinhaonella thermotolerans TaxID=1070861 RepID=A0A3A4A2P0_9ACTN|nr:GNAT family N-acetyltransferase [Bailinhaonella thermotolerans]RJL22996.1 GNAT family N-acetyltransferase [Bailinhaonella thermotolerans]
MNGDDVMAAFDRQMRREARPDGPGARVERDGPVVRQVGGEGGWNAVLWSDLTEDDADAAIAAQVAYFTGLGREFEWKLYDYDTPGDLGVRLRAAGFEAEPEEAVMVTPVAGQPTEVVLPEGVRLRRVTDPDEVAMVAEVHERAFGTSAEAFARRLRARLQQDPDSLEIVVAMAGDEPVSAARVDFEPGTDFAGLWGGGTVAGWRGKGIYRALVAHRARAAAERGYRYLQVDASDQSRPILHRLGFTTLTTTTPYVYTP